MIEIKVTWDEEKQAPMLNFDPAQIKTHDYAVMILEAALSALKFAQELARMQAHAQAMMQAQQNANDAAAIASAINGRRLR